MRKHSFKILVALILLMSGLGVHFYRTASALKADPNLAVQKETAELLARVGKLIMLPEGEAPTVAVVTDLEKLKGQPFFVKAKVGDKVLLYQKARKAYLFDPVANKILEVAPILLDTGTEPEKAIPEASETPKKKTR